MFMHAYNGVLQLKGELCTLIQKAKQLFMGGIAGGVYSSCEQDTVA